MSETATNWLDGRPRVCDYCHREYVARHPSSRYCCPSHKNSAKRVRQRIELRRLRAQMTALESGE